MELVLEEQVSRLPTPTPTPMLCTTHLYMHAQNIPKERYSVTPEWQSWLALVDFETAAIADKFEDPVDLIR